MSVYWASRWINCGHLKSGSIWEEEKKLEFVMCVRGNLVVTWGRNRSKIILIHIYEQFTLYGLGEDVVTDFESTMCSPICHLPINKCTLLWRDKTSLEKIFFVQAVLRLTNACKQLLSDWNIESIDLGHLYVNLHVLSGQFLITCYSNSRGILWRMWCII